MDYVYNFILRIYILTSCVEIPAIYLKKLLLIRKQERFMINH